MRSIRTGGRPGARSAPPTPCPARLSPTVAPRPRPGAAPGPSTSRRRADLGGSGRTEPPGFRGQPRCPVLVAQGAPTADSQSTMTAWLLAVPASFTRRRRPMRDTRPGPLFLLPDAEAQDGRPFPTLSTPSPRSTSCPVTPHGGATPRPHSDELAPRTGPQSDPEYPRRRRRSIVIGDEPIDARGMGTPFLLVLGFFTAKRRRGGLGCISQETQPDVSDFAPALGVQPPDQQS